MNAVCLQSGEMGVVIDCSVSVKWLIEQAMWQIGWANP